MGTFFCKEAFILLAVSRTFFVTSNRSALALCVRIVRTATKSAYLCPSFSRVPIKVTGKVMGF